MFKNSDKYNFYDIWFCQFSKAGSIWPSSGENPPSNLRNNGAGIETGKIKFKCLYNGCPGRTNYIK